MRARKRERRKKERKNPYPVGSNSHTQIERGVKVCRIAEYRAAR
jgi:hypothetical protein